MEYQTIFDTMQISMIIYLIIIIIASVVIIAFGLYVAYEYYRGISLKQLFWGRIKGWTNKKIALFEIFNPINTVRFEYAHREIGDVYKFGENSKEFIQTQVDKKPGIISKIISVLLFKKKSESKIAVNEISDDIITPKSVYSINSVKTIPLFEPYPKLNGDIEKGLNALISKEIYTLEDLIVVMDNVELKNEILFDNYTYERFYELYMDSKNKYELNITIKDVVGFMSNTFDKNFRFSIESKDFNVKMSKKNDKTMQKYSYYILFICALIAAGMLIYKRVYG